MVINQSVEDYLEAVYILQKRNGSCRSIDVANFLSYTKASVSVAISKLSSEGYLIKHTNGQLVLTSSGLAIAEKIYERHDFFANLFMNLGVDEQTSFEDACQIEHAVSSETFMKLKQYFENHPIQK